MLEAEGCVTSIQACFKTGGGQVSTLNRMSFKMKDFMSPQAKVIKFTYEDYILFPDDGKRHELIDGEHYMTPAPSTRHQRVSARLKCKVILLNLYK